MSKRNNAPLVPTKCTILSDICYRMNHTYSTYIGCFNSVFLLSCAKKRTERKKKLFCCCCIVVYRHFGWEFVDAGISAFGIAVEIYHSSQRKWCILLRRHSRYCLRLISWYLHTTSVSFVAIGFWVAICCRWEYDEREIFCLSIAHFAKFYRKR